MVARGRQFDTAFAKLLWSFVIFVFVVIVTVIIVVISVLSSYQL